MERSRLTAGVTLPREPKQDRSRRKQEQLMASAEALFTDPGFEQVTADDIAAHAGYGTGTFYNYFANKTQAFLMVAGAHETAIAPTVETVAQALAEDADLFEVAADTVRRIIADREAVPWLRRTWLRLALTDPEVDAVQRGLDEEWDAALTGVVTTAFARRGVELDPAVAATFATTLRVLVDAVADEVVLAGAMSPDDAATAVAGLVTALVNASGA